MRTSCNFYNFDSRLIFKTFEKIRFDFLPKFVSKFIEILYPYITFFKGPSILVVIH